MAERLAEDLWRLDIPLVGNPLKNLNSYLLTGERSLLTDMGFRWTFSAPTSTATTQGGRRS